MDEDAINGYDAESFSNKIEVIDNTPSSSTRGAMIVFGGIGILTTVPATSVTAGGGLTVVGGVSIAQNTIHGGDILVLSSTDSTSTSSGSLLTMGGAGIQKSLNVAKLFDVSSYQTGTASTSGQYLNFRPSEFRDSTASANSTVPNAMFNTIDIPTVSATNANVRVTNAATLYVKGGPSAGVNVTIDKSFGLVADGNTRLQNLEITGTLSVIGLVSNTEDTWLSDTKTVGTNGGDFFKNAWRTRTLNTISSTSGGVSLSGNTITLSPGSYNFMAIVPSYNVESNITRLFNVTNSNVATLGSSNYSDKANSASTLFGLVTATVTTQYRIEHYSLKDRQDTGFGRATGITAEIYTQVLIQRLSSTPVLTPSLTETYISDVKTVGSNGGDFLKNAWRTRTLNTISSTSGGATLSGNTITLSPGAYRLLARVPSYDVDSNKARLFNTTINQAEIQGTSNYTDKANSDTWISGALTPLAPTSYIIQHYSLKDRTDTGFGRATGIGPEVYTTVYIKKL